jgi:hypothetical protein
MFTFYTEIDAWKYCDFWRDSEAVFQLILEGGEAAEK